MSRQAKEIESIVIKYKNGTEKEIKKGAVMEAEEKNGNTLLNMHMCSMSGKDLTLIVYAGIELGRKLNIFTDKEENENGEN